VAPYNPEAHNRTLWAAYRVGALPFLPADIMPEEFPLTMLEYVAQAFKQGVELAVLENNAGRAIGLMVMRYSPVSATRRIGHPDPIWFPWATTRNKLEVSVRLMVDVKARLPMFKAVPKDEKWNGDRLLEHLRRYGLVRPIGMFWRYYADGKDGVFWQSS